MAVSHDKVLVRSAEWDVLDVFHVRELKQAWLPDVYGFHVEKGTCNPDVTDKAVGFGACWRECIKDKTCRCFTYDRSGGCSLGEEFIDESDPGVDKSYYVHVRDVDETGDVVGGCDLEDPTYGLSICEARRPSDCVYENGGCQDQCLRDGTCLCNGKIDDKKTCALKCPGPDVASIGCPYAYRCQKNC
jgi:hypothetical protein